MEVKRITNKDRKLIYEYNVTIDDLEEICKEFPNFRKEEIKNTLTNYKCVLKKVNGVSTLYSGDKLWNGNTDSDEEIVDALDLDSPDTESENPTKE